MLAGFHALIAAGLHALIAGAMASGQPALWVAGAGARARTGQRFRPGNAGAVTERVNAANSAATDADDAGDLPILAGPCYTRVTYAVLARSPSDTQRSSG